MKTETGEKKGRGSILTSRNRRFITLVLSGKTQAHAYRIAFNHPRMDSTVSSKRAHKIALQPAVAEKLREIKGKSDVKTLLTLNDRLSILASHAQAKVKNAADRNASTRAIDVYSKIAEGETLNVKAEVSGPGGGPLQHRHSGGVSVTQIIAKFRAAREGRTT